MDGIHDMGGMQGWGTVHYDAGEPAFKAPWEGRAFAISLLSMNRLTGCNLDAMRHALERLTPLEYLKNGYYGRWLLLSETLLTDSGAVPLLVSVTLRGALVVPSAWYPKSRRAGLRLTAGAGRTPLPVSET